MESQSKRRRPLITVHGIRTPADWQKDLDGLLTAHYEHHPFNYREYRGPVLALFWLALAPLALLAGICLVAMTAFAVVSLALGPVASSIALVAALCTSSLLYLLGKYQANSRLDNLVVRLKQHIEDRAGAVAPDIIAHSLGSFLVGSVLSRFWNIQVNRVILAGSVMHPEFSWAELKKVGRVFLVRNEMATNDWVPDIAGMRLIPGIPGIPGIGNAGAVGFQGPGVKDRCTPDEILYLDSPCAACANDCRCWAPPSREYVQNVHFPNMRHTDWFKGTGHAVRVWMPVLWGVSPGHYSGFLEACSKYAFKDLAQTMTSERRSAIVGAGKQLSESCWGWVTPHSALTVDKAARLHLQEFFTEKGVSAPDEWEETVSFAIHQLATIVADAARDPLTKACDLHPHIALQKAVKTAGESVIAKSRGAGA